MTAAPDRGARRRRRPAARSEASPPVAATRPTGSRAPHSAAPSGRHPVDGSARSACEGETGGSRGSTSSPTRRATARRGVDRRSHGDQHRPAARRGSWPAADRRSAAASRWSRWPARPDPGTAVAPDRARTPSDLHHCRSARDGISLWGRDGGGGRFAAGRADELTRGPATQQDSLGTAARSADPGPAGARPPPGSGTPFAWTLDGSPPPRRERTYVSLHAAV